jgi:hypothetical protein
MARLARLTWFSGGKLVGRLVLSKTTQDHQSTGQRCLYCGVELPAPQHKIIEIGQLPIRTCPEMPLDALGVFPGDLLES